MSVRKPASPAVPNTSRRRPATVFGQDCKLSEFPEVVIQRFLDGKKEFNGHARIMMKFSNILGLGVQRSYEAECLVGFYENHESVRIRLPLFVVNSSEHHDWPVMIWGLSLGGVHVTNDHVQLTKWLNEAWDSKILTVMRDLFVAQVDGTLVDGYPKDKK